MTKHVDVLVLGSGNAGMAAARVAREAGKSVAMVEARDVGGTCPLSGCVPKKVLVAAAQVLDQIEKAPQHHISLDNVRLDWGQLVARERTFVDGVPEQFAASLEQRGIELIRGHARFVAANRVRVGEREIEAASIVIATGSRPRTLPIAGAGDLITSEDLLELNSLPASLIFIGGGAVALEFAHVLARAGTEVTILEAMERLLPRADADAVERLHRESERIGIRILTGADVKSVKLSGNRFEVRVEHAGRVRTMRADLVANGAGREPNLAGLDLTVAGIEHEGTRIIVDDNLRSVSNPHVYVAGDALWSSAQLSPVASYEGQIVGENLVNGAAHTPDYASIPAAV